MNCAASEEFRSKFNSFYTKKFVKKKKVHVFFFCYYSIGERGNTGKLIVFDYDGTCNSCSKLSVALKLPPLLPSDTEVKLREKTEEKSKKGHASHRRAILR